MSIKIGFGLESQGHINTIERILKKWNESFNEQYPEHPIKDTMTYDKSVWEEIGKTIGWEPFTACLHYFKYKSTKAP